jgi:hypothetical protein
LNGESLNNLEILGALSTRLAHALSSHLSVITGNLCVATTLRDEQVRAASALQSALNAANEAAAVLTRFAEVHRTLNLDRPTTPMDQLLELLQEWAEKREGWVIETDALVKFTPEFLLAAPWPWVAFVLDIIRQETGAGAGIIRLSPASSTNRSSIRQIQGSVPVARVRISVHYRSAQEIVWNKSLQALKNFKLAAAGELLHHIGGSPESGNSTAGTQESAFTLSIISA